ncbi:MAG TPA: hypothetical protein VLN73_01040, partial [Alphaproteobacteria bacterium]|nr:hypothetical protein [Alphaproteobacteria bacterium]
MSPKSFLALALITLVFAAGAAWMVATQDTGTGVRGEGRILFPDLVTKVNDVRRVKVTQGTGTSTLVAEEKDGEV